MTQYSLSTRCVFIRELQLDVSIGILDHERHGPQPVVISLEMYVPETTRATSTDIADYVSYSDVVDAIRKITATGRHFELVENLAEDIADLVLADGRVASVTVEISKPDIVADAAGVGVIIERPLLGG